MQPKPSGAAPANWNLAMLRNDSGLSPSRRVVADAQVNVLASDVDRDGMVDLSGVEFSNATIALPSETRVTLRLSNCALEGTTITRGGTVILSRGTSARGLRVTAANLHLEGDASVEDARVSRGDFAIRDVATARRVRAGDMFRVRSGSAVVEHCEGVQLEFSDSGAAGAASPAGHVSRSRFISAYIANNRGEMTDTYVRDALYLHQGEVRNCDVGSAHIMTPDVAISGTRARGSWSLYRLARAKGHSGVNIPRGEAISSILGNVEGELKHAPLATHPRVVLAASSGLQPIRAEWICRDDDLALDARNTAAWDAFVDLGGPGLDVRERVEVQRLALALNPNP